VLCEVSQQASQPAIQPFLLVSRECSSSSRNNYLVFFFFKSPGDFFYLLALLGVTSMDPAIYLNTMCLIFCLFIYLFFVFLWMALLSNQSHG
jgi:hypothetical protein